jgi:hypothetical protein
MSIRDEVLGRVDRWCADVGVSPRQLGYRATSSGNAVRRLRLGQSVTLDTVDKLIGYMSAHSTAADQVKATPL